MELAVAIQTTRNEMHTGDEQVGRLLRKFAAEDNNNAYANTDMMYTTTVAAEPRAAAENKNTNTTTKNNSNSSTTSTICKPTGCRQMPGVQIFIKGAKSATFCHSKVKASCPNPATTTTLKRRCTSKCNYCRVRQTHLLRMPSSVAFNVLRAPTNVLIVMSTAQKMCIRIVYSSTHRRAARMPFASPAARRNVNITILTPTQSGMHVRMWTSH